MATTKELLALLRLLRALPTETKEELLVTLRELQDNGDSLTLPVSWPLKEKE